MIDYIAIIPARYASSRLPGKPLMDIAGKPMIQWVYEQTQKSSASRVIVATDNQQIGDTVAEFGGEICMTSPDHVSGTDRLQEVTNSLQLDDDAIVVNVQGDEPLIPPDVIDQVAVNLAHYTRAGIATLCETVEDIEAFLNPNVVKVVFDHEGYAHYFSRAPIPWPRDQFVIDQTTLPKSKVFHRHIGIYAYRVSLLNRFVSWEPAPLEKTECLEQLRAMWHGVGIHVAESCQAVPAGVDTEADLEHVRNIIVNQR